jgi:hypothetical protein
LDLFLGDVKNLWTLPVLLLQASVKQSESPGIVSGALLCKSNNGLLSESVKSMVRPSNLMQVQQHGNHDESDHPGHGPGLETILLSWW